MQPTEPTGVSIMEVGPRDGLQNESVLVETSAKIAMISGLADAGLKRIEITSFVNPRWIPALADHDEVARGIPRRPGVDYAGLVPNLRGYENACAAGMAEVGLVVSVSETHNRKNVNASVAATLEGFAEIARRARSDGVRFRGYVSTAFGCPYEGPQDPGRVAALATRFMELGAYQVSLGDTIGVATPRQVREMLASVGAQVPVDRLGLHLHDTRGQALVNAFAGIEAGVRSVDSSVGGLGGCPYAPGASGNLATEDLVYMLEGMGVPTGVDLDALVRVTVMVQRLLGRTLPSRYAQAGRWLPRQRS